MYWNDIEDSGHEFTMVTGPNAGEFFYYCERCGCLLMMGGDSKVLLFHPVKGSYSTPESYVRWHPYDGDQTMLYMRQYNYLSYPFGILSEGILWKSGCDSFLRWDKANGND